jgi:hypothetical protein
MEYEVGILALFVFVVLMMVFYKKIQTLISKYKIAKNSQEYIYAHELVMTTGEILSRPPTDRYPDMETNQAKVKQYYQRVNSLPVNIKNANTEFEKSQNVKPILQSVK